MTKIRAYPQPKKYTVKIDWASELEEKTIDGAIEYLQSLKNQGLDPSLKLQGAIGSDGYYPSCLTFSGYETELEALTRRKNYLEKTIERDLKLEERLNHISFVNIVNELEAVQLKLKELETEN